MRILPIATTLVLAACTSETTSFRTTDRGDGSEHTGPPAAVYDMADAARVRVWSNGGYISSSGEPMSHVGFEIQNTSKHAIVFDSDALQLVVFDKTGTRLPPATFTTVTPLGAAQVRIGAAQTTSLDAYFLLPVRPRVVDAMRAHWSLTIDDARYDQTTGFVRDDDLPIDSPPAPEALPPNT